ncbi:hypothetical protein NDU88_000709 [Pleurodeles waltl]|uniref:Uncharacterized protein n=1 Tax=Pleurodeles waltl TaxID=8319 RepID=A0AAV7P230_PLEWA|nr:hypothetical protein NDU88_000709 [Pleurodeles waltl]
MVGLTAGSRRLFGGPPKWLGSPDLGFFDAARGSQPRGACCGVALLAWRSPAAAVPSRQCGTRFVPGSLRGRVACLAVPQRAVIPLPDCQRVADDRGPCCAAGSCRLQAVPHSSWDPFFRAGRSVCGSTPQLANGPDARAGSHSLRRRRWKREVTPSSMFLEVRLACFDVPGECSGAHLVGGGVRSLGQALVQAVDTRWSL